MLIVVAGCDDDEEPVDIPFEGLEPSAARQLPTPIAVPTASASASPKPTAVKINPAVAAVRACCNALRAKSGSADDKGSRAVNKQAAAVCQQRVGDVLAGRMTKAQALSSVRGSLLGKAPFACR